MKLLNPHPTQQILMSFLKKYLLPLWQVKSTQQLYHKSSISQSCSIVCNYNLLNNTKQTSAIGLVCQYNFNLVRTVSLSYSDKNGVNRSPSPKPTGKRKRVQVICSDDEEDVTADEWVFIQIPINCFIVGLWLIPVSRYL